MIEGAASQRGTPPDRLELIRPHRSLRYVQNEPLRKIAVDEMAQARFLPTFPGTDEFRDIVMPLVQAAVEGQKTAKDALAEAAAKVQPLLDRNL